MPAANARIDIKSIFLRWFWMYFLAINAAKKGSAKNNSHPPLDKERKDARIPKDPAKRREKRHMKI